MKKHSLRREAGQGRWTGGHTHTGVHEINNRVRRTEAEMRFVRFRY